MRILLLLLCLVSVVYGQNRKKVFEVARTESILIADMDTNMIAIINDSSAAGYNAFVWTDNAGNFYRALADSQDGTILQLTVLDSAMIRYLVADSIYGTFIGLLDIDSIKNDLVVNGDLIVDSALTAQTVVVAETLTAPILKGDTKFTGVLTAEDTATAPVGVFQKIDNDTIDATIGIIQKNIVDTLSSTGDMKISANNAVSFTSGGMMTYSTTSGMTFNHTAFGATFSVPWTGPISLSAGTSGIPGTGNNLSLIADDTTIVKGLSHIYNVDIDAARVNGDLTVSKTATIETVHTTVLIVDSVFSNNGPHLYAGFNDSIIEIVITESVKVQITNGNNDLWQFKHSTGFKGLADTVEIAYAGAYDIDGFIAVEGIANKVFHIGVYNVDSSRVEGFYSAFGIDTKIDQYQCPVCIKTGICGVGDRLIMYIENVTDGTNIEIYDAAIKMKFYHKDF